MLKQAVDLYRGDFLAGLSLANRCAIDEWRLVTQEYLYGQLVDALDQLISYHELHREYRLAERYLRRLLASEPWREEAHRQLMRILARQGQRCGALRQYEICRAVLRDELATAPDAETETLLQHIRAGKLYPERIEADNPYQGLLPFDEANAADFYGRATLVEHLIHKLHDQPVVTLIGPSSCGKSSLVQAGLTPRLKASPAGPVARHATPKAKEKPDWIIITLQPGVDPFRSLARAVVPWLHQASEVEALALALRQGAIDLHTIAGHILDRQSTPNTHLLVIVDQLEQIFSACPNPRARESFVACLIGHTQSHERHEAGIPSPARRGRDPRLAMLLLLRANFIELALSDHLLGQAIRRGGLVMGTMSRADLRRTIEQPAWSRGVTFEPSLVERLMDDTGNRPDNLPLLQFTLTQLWNRQTDGQLTHAAYEAMGRLAGALSYYADQVIEQLSGADQATGRRVFTQLEPPTESTEDDTGCQATRIEPGEAGWSLVQQLADARLVVTGSMPDRQDYAEVVHEALIRHWERLPA